LEVADSLVKAGQVDLATDVYRDLIQLRNLPEEVHVRCAALHGFAGALGARAVSDVLAALTDENPELRAAALEIAVELSAESVTEAYVNELDGASPEVRVAILNVLARRGAQSALPAVLAAFDDEAKDVRVAAIKAAAMIGGEKVVDPLVPCLGRDDDDEREVAEDELVKLRGEAVTADLTDALAESSSRTKCSLLKVLSRRRGTDQLDTIKKYTRHNDEAVRIAAIEAVGELAADVPTVQRLLLLLGAVEAEDEREVIEKALIDVCKRPDDNASHIGTVVDDIDQADMPKYCSLLRVLGHLGGQSASEILLAAARDPHAEVVEAALRGFDSFPDPDRSMTALVLELAADMTETKAHVLGMRAFASLLKRTEADVAEKLDLYQAGLESARRVEEKRLLLSGMAEVKDTRTLDALAPYLDDEKLRSETGSAMIMAARGTLPRGWPQAHHALERVLASVTEDRVRRHAQDVMKEVERFEDFVTDWRVAGPYFVEGKAGHEILEAPFPPEEPGAQNVEWKEQPINEGWDDFWHVDLTRSIGGDHRAAYLRTHVWSEHEQPILLELGSDDGIKAWLNCEAIHANNALRGCGPAQDQVTATLKQGWNKLMLKVTNDGGGWGACARLRSADGGSVSGVRIDANGQPDSPPRHD
ncbi:MAG: HEAT repeat domain-containing protein, partial [Planctomycetes bacterium]|nr:HEAT repeat domain-containing protein [Planctomycetota bacterium]